ncbi:tumor necrosis factor receptor superfamily member 10A-like isoform X1 [Cervus elaphus]|uniref:tumor necrosis factor receptor superfamily member 10A-like isoform X1 n=1 Tax=Cervus elaphus TaxID=9860 RepID=UPI001CC2D244|nr:tumor necrosis factor receptor superfamily member 10A-like isoform X1 [Cervus elaphus]
MTVPAINLRGPRQRTLPGRKGQRGRRAPASSSAAAGRSGGLKLRFGYLVFVMGVVSWVKPASAMSIRKDEVPQQLSAPLEWIRQQNLCPPGFYMEEVSGGCAPCTDGTDYTNHSNTLPSCLPCTTCKSEEEEKNRCTSSKDTECQCKPGTFRGEDAPEFCQKCSAGCPDGKVMVMNCTPWSNVKCVDQESGTSPLVTNIFTGLGITVVITFVLIRCVVCCFSKVCFGECCHKEKKLTEDNAQSQDEASRESGDPALVLFCLWLPVPEFQNHVYEAQLCNLGPSMKTKAALHCVLQKPAASEGSQGRRWLLVPTDATESLKLFFSDSAAISPL